jgi:hypothetical protein
MTMASSPQTRQGISGQASKLVGHSFILLGTATSIMYLTSPKLGLKHHKTSWLVGGAVTILKNMSSSIGRMTSGYSI